MLFSFSCSLRAFGTRTDASGPSSVGEHSVIFVRSCQDCHMNISGYQICVCLVLWWFFPTQSCCYSHLSATFPMIPPRLAESSNCGTGSPQRLCSFSPLNISGVTLFVGTTASRLQKSQRCCILGLIDMGEPKQVYHRNLKTPESQTEGTMGIPLLHIRGGQRSYLGGQSNCETCYALDLSTPRG